MIIFSKKHIFFFVFLVFLIISIDILFLRNKFEYIYITYYLIFLPLYFCCDEKIKITKDNFYNLIFFLIGVFFLFLVQYLHSFHNSKVLFLSFLFFICAFILFYIRDYLYNSSRLSFKKDRVSTNKEITFIIFLFLISIFIRIYKINTIPMGVWFDEAQNGNEVIKLLRENKITIFIPRLTQMPAMYFYIAAFLTKIFGINIFSLRFVSILLGSLSVIAFYFLLREIFKDAFISFLGSILFSFSRWHLTFSRIAFLGMQAMFLEIVFLYFYIKTLRNKKTFYPILAGLTLGISQYTFSTANFLFLFLFLHSIVIFFKKKEYFYKHFIKQIFLISIIAFIIISPLLKYAINHPEEFFRRAKDVSIINDIKKKKTFEPILINIKRYLLMFSYEGDYNGRHNLYKQPAVDKIAGVLLFLGIIINLLKRNFFYMNIILFFVFLLPGILTITIEAPQFYRTICVIPIVYIFITYSLIEIKFVLKKIDKNKKHINIFLINLIVLTSAINFYQYFVLYPKEKASYMDFSPVATEIAKTINKESKNFYILVSKVENEYGFYYWEQKVVCEFLTYDKGIYKEFSLKDKQFIFIDKNILNNKKGILIILRPSDKEYIKLIEKNCKNLKKEVFINKFTKEPMFIKYYILKDSLKNIKIIHLK